MDISPLPPPIREVHCILTERRLAGQIRDTGFRASKQLPLTSLQSSSLEPRIQGCIAEELPRSQHRHCTAPASITSAYSLTVRAHHSDRPHATPSHFFLAVFSREIIGLPESPWCSWRRTLVRGPNAHPRNLPHPLTTPK